MSNAGFDNHNLFEENMVLRCEVKSLQHTIEEYRSEKRYQKIQKDNNRVIAGYIKEIKRLKKELSDAHAQNVTARNIWTEQCNRLWDEQMAESAAQNETIRQLEDRIWNMKLENDGNTEALKAEYEEKLYQKDCIIDELKNRLAHAEALLGRDSTNTNIPTGQTPAGKNKHIPNSRRGSRKNKGGQPGHEKHTMKRPAPDEITDEIDHEIREGEYCPRCGSGDFTYTGEYEERYETDIEIIVKKKAHKYWLYRCNACGETVRTGTGPNLRAECQYGSITQALALSLMNTANTAIKSVEEVGGDIGEGFSLSEIRERRTKKDG